MSSTSVLSALQRQRAALKRRMEERMQQQSKQDKDERSTETVSKAALESGQPANDSVAAPTSSAPPTQRRRLDADVSVTASSNRPTVAAESRHPHPSSTSTVPPPKFSFSRPPPPPPPIPPATATSAAAASATATPSSRSPVSGHRSRAERDREREKGRERGRDRDKREEDRRQSRSAASHAKGSASASSASSGVAAGSSTRSIVSPSPSPPTGLSPSQSHSHSPPVYSPSLNIPRNATNIPDHWKTADMRHVVSLDLSQQFVNSQGTDRPCNHLRDSEWSGGGEDQDEGKDAEMEHVMSMGHPQHASSTRARDLDRYGGDPDFAWFARQRARAAKRSRRCQPFMAKKWDLRNGIQSFMQHSTSGSNDAAKSHAGDPNMDLVALLGGYEFDVILIDPPWAEYEERRLGEMHTEDMEIGGGIDRGLNVGTEGEQHAISGSVSSPAAASPVVDLTDEAATIATSGSGHSHSTGPSSSPTRSCPSPTMSHSSSPVSSTPSTSVWSARDLAQLPIASIAAEPCICFLWVRTGSKHMAEGWELLQGWGFKVVEDIVWIQSNKSHQDRRGHMDSSSFFQRTVEHVLVGLRGSEFILRDRYMLPAQLGGGAPIECLEKGMVQFVYPGSEVDAFVAEIPEDEGSTAKPPDLYRLIEHYCMGRRRLELFGTDNNIRDGWVTIGLDISEQMERWDMDAYKNLFETERPCPSVDPASSAPDSTLPHPLPPLPFDARLTHYIPFDPSLEQRRPKSPPIPSVGNSFSERNQKPPHVRLPRRRRRVWNEGRTSGMVQILERIDMHVRQQKLQQQQQQQQSGASMGQPPHHPHPYGFPHPSHFSPPQQQQQQHQQQQQLQQHQHLSAASRYLVRSMAMTGSGNGGGALYDPEPIPFSAARPINAASVSPAPMIPTSSMHGSAPTSFRSPPHASSTHTGARAHSPQPHAYVHNGGFY